MGETSYRKSNAIPSDQSATFFSPEFFSLSTQLSGDGSDSYRKHVSDFLIKEAE